ncbi:MAG: hypothetical protein JXB35_13425 [Anaerolineae bacterium]|nr:hypothetical protein [Anaerolineae bacterium]
MGELVTQTVYFERPGAENTERALTLGRARAKALGLQTLVIATTTGASAVRASEVFTGFRIVALTHSAGFIKPDMQDLTPDNRALLESAGVQLLTCQHALGGVGRAVRKKFGTYQVDEIIAHTLRIFGQGIKVVIEISLMAADAGLVSVSEPTLVAAGTKHGIDTVVIMQPANAQAFFDVQMMEIICRPSPGHPAFE